MASVSAVEFQRRFGQIRTLAQREPVVVTNHGRADLVVMSADAYRQLIAGCRTVVRARDMTDEDLAALDRSVIPPEARAFDHEMEYE